AHFAALTAGNEGEPAEGRKVELYRVRGAATGHDREHDLLTHVQARAIHRSRECQAGSLLQQQQQREHYQSFPGGGAARSFRCRAICVPSSSRSIDVRICSAWLLFRPPLDGDGDACCGCGLLGPPLWPPPPPPVGGGRMRSASSRFHLARSELGASS